MQSSSSSRQALLSCLSSAPLRCLIERKHVQEHLKQSGVQFACLLTAGFYQNYVRMTQYMKEPDGTFVRRDDSG